MRLLISLASTLALVTGCGSDATIDGDWQLVSGEVDGRPVPIVEGHRITLSVSGSQLGGRSACNHYGAQLSYGPRSMLGEIAIEISEVAGTAMGCEEEVMASEAAYTQALGRVESASHTGERLVLSGGGAELHFSAVRSAERDPLVDTQWILESLVDGDVAFAPQGERAFLELRPDGSLRGSTGCRELSGTYVLHADEVLTTQLAADGECPPHLEAQDGLIVSVIGDGFVPRPDGRRLFLESSGGQGLVYTRSE